jgi:hypothetical protein
MMTGHRSLEMVLRYDHHRESLELNAVNFLDYTEKLRRPGAGAMATEDYDDDQVGGEGRQ